MAYATAWMMVRRLRSFLLALALRTLVVLLSGSVALIAINAWQDHALPSGTSFDIVFDRLEWAIYGAVATGLIAAAAMVFFQARRFSLVERTGLSCAAVGLILVIMTTTNIVH
jgi:hypothetical protein